ncbi:DUF881 domain-containing protein [Aldersonia sp. NBC_00410]|uniref:DUF881 domain-containing protein n=1 Tax=Aldersonia sp. NBC_00410 TaxID=2975954 RepID=UPI002252D185|nr:DUF881 domain-containing protein [Aldersonia sp. NBC_00410]MCX5044355.1 DUF881 domain-containing protein [Aldersonia sp. NBC_00410]
MANEANDVSPDPVEESPEQQPPPGQKRVRKASPRALQVLALILIGVLGIAIATQIRDTDSGSSLDSARPTDLLALLDNLNRREASLRQEIATLQGTIAGLEQRGSSAAVDEARARLSALSVQVGTVPASGPGVVLTIADPALKVGPDVLLDAVQELRAAGAEAIQIGGAGGDPLRVGINTWIGGTPGAVIVDGVTLTAPYTVVAIGDPPTLAAAVNIPGGVVDSVSRSGGTLVVEQREQVAVTATRDPTDPHYAQPGN